MTLISRPDYTSGFFDGVAEIIKMIFSVNILKGAPLLVLSITACSPPQIQQGDIQVNVIGDSQTVSVSISAGSTARDAVIEGGFEISNLDRSEPPLFTVLDDEGDVRLIRVVEEFEIVENVVSYKTNTLNNESLPQGEQLLVQSGENGLQEITYRAVIEDGVEISRSPVKTVVVQEPIDEIIMVGSQSPFAAQPINGRLAYLSGGSAWIIEENTGNRRPLITSGDLDGRIFRLSPDGDWLLFTRKDEDEEVINTLWVAKVDDDSGLEVDLKTENVIHFASWRPGATQRIIVSTAEATSSPPGWQANNNLEELSYSRSGFASFRKSLVDENSGGVYGWMGTRFVWSPDGETLAYARPDGIGIVNFETETYSPILEITPLQTGSDWAWIPSLSWSPNGDVLFTVDHAVQEGLVSQEESPLFDLTAVPLKGGAPVSINTHVGMFGSPASSAIEALSNGEQSYKIAYLQAFDPLKSDSSKYQLMIMDRDGSNVRAVFPSGGAPGLVPQEIIWGLPAEEETSEWIALKYEGNLWIINVNSGQSQQLTGDGSVTALDWK